MNHKYVPVFSSGAVFIQGLLPHMGIGLLGRGAAFLVVRFCTHRGGGRSHC